MGALNIMEPQSIASVRTANKASTLATGLSRQEEAWHSAYEKLAEFVQSEGHLQVPATVSSDGVPLNKWQSLQIARFHNRTLDREKAKLLEKLPGWSWSGPTAAWEKYYKMLLAFVSRQGHANVPPSHRESGAALGLWVKGQRRLYHQGGLMRESKDRLENLPGWQWSAPRAFPKRGNKLQSVDTRIGEGSLASWEEAYACLQAWLQEHRTSMGIRKNTLENSDLRRWVFEQKQACMKGTLSADRRRLLEKVPGIFSEREKERLWHETFESLWFYAKKGKNILVPRDYEVDGVFLGEWVEEQRRLYRLGKLAPNQIKKLEGLTGWTWLRPCPEPGSDQR
jgi:hypothetical protein